VEQQSTSNFVQQINEQKLTPKKKRVDKRTIFHSGSPRIDKRSAHNNPEGTPRKRVNIKRVNITSNINSGIYYSVKLF